MKQAKPKIIAILGPTASGKTAMAAKLAAEISGEIVSADSRQVYQGMDIGSGKDLREYSVEFENKTIQIPYHLIDVADPAFDFTLADYLLQAKTAVMDILSRGRAPIICGGTGLYAQALIEGFALTGQPADPARRREWEAMAADELFRELKRLDPAKAEAMNNSDRNNKRRLIRCLEKILADPGSGKISGLNPDAFDIKIFVIDKPMAELENKIKRRLHERLANEDMISEVSKLRESGLSWDRLESFGLEYRYVSRYLRGEFSEEQMESELFIAIRQFAKRQLTWLRRWEKQGRMMVWVSDDSQVEI